jgi:hypothetical protein
MQALDLEIGFPRQRCERALVSERLTCFVAGSVLLVSDDQSDLNIA